MKMSQRDKFVFVKCPQCGKYIIADDMFNGEKCPSCHTPVSLLIEMAYRKQQRINWFLGMIAAFLLTAFLYMMWI